MRLVRFKHTNPKVPPLLVDISKQFRADPGFVFDLYSLMALKGNGLPSEQRLDRIIDRLHSESANKMSKVHIRIVARKRLTELKTINGNVLFQGFMRRKDRIDALREYFLDTLEFQRKMRQAQCLSCKFKGDCDFGKQYSGKLNDITRALDPNYDKLVHEDCPVRPEIETSNRLAMAAQQMAQMLSKGNAAQTAALNPNSLNTQAGRDAFNAAMNSAANAQECAEDAALDMSSGDLDCGDEDGDDGDADNEEDVPAHYAVQTGQGGASKRFDVRFAGNEFHLAHNFIKSVSSADLILYELGRKFSVALSTQKKGKFSPVPNINKAQTQRKMETASDVSKLEASQHGLPEEIFDAKEERKELTKIQHQKPEEKKQLLYLLIDASGSMGGQLCGMFSASILSRCALSGTFSIALTHRVEEDKGIMFVRFFAGDAGPRIAARDAASFETLRKQIALASYNGGGTNIRAALNKAMADITQAGKEDDLAHAEILCITDCEDYFNEADVRKAVGDTEFNVLDVSGGSGVNAALKAAATKYYKVPPNTTLDIDKIVELV